MSAETEVQATLDDPLTDHSYDGILEYDNPLPGWWTFFVLGVDRFFVFLLGLFSFWS